jgi:hypothetical protein
VDRLLPSLVRLCAVDVKASPAEVLNAHTVAVAVAVAVAEPKLHGRLLPAPRRAACRHRCTATCSPVPARGTGNHRRRLLQNGSSDCVGVTFTLKCLSLLLKCLSLILLGNACVQSVDEVSCHRR